MQKSLAVLTTTIVLQSCAPNVGWSADSDIDWPINQSYIGDRFSTLKQITTDNVGPLMWVANFPVP